jgi:GT2 family glycosyltransferase
LKGFAGAGEPTPDMEMILRARAAGFRIFRAADAVVVHDPERVDFASVFRYAAVHARRTIVLRGQHRQLLKTPFVLRSPLLTLMAAPAVAAWVTFRIYTRNRRTAAHWQTIPVVWALKVAWCWGAASGLSASRAVENH